MAKRTCAQCGKEKDVYGGKICSKDHFICQDCARYRSDCPLCKSKLK
jgi:transposase-like protein